MIAELTPEGELAGEGRIAPACVVIVSGPVTGSICIINPLLWHSLAGLVPSSPASKLPRHRAQERTADCFDPSTLLSLPQMISFCVCGPLTSRPTLRVQSPCLRVQVQAPPEDHKKCSVVLETGWELTLSRHVMEFSGDLSITIKTD